MGEARLKFVALLVLIFILGIATGAFGYRLLSDKGYFSSRGRGPARVNRGEVVERFTRELGLSAQQREQLNVILTEDEQKFRELNKSIKPQADAIRQEGRNRIRAILTDEQKPKFEEMLRKIDEQRRQREASRQ